MIQTACMNGALVLGQSRVGQIEREQEMTKRGSDRNHYSNWPCRCLEMGSPSLLCYLLLCSCLLSLTVCTLTFLLLYCVLLIHCSVFFLFFNNMSKVHLLQGVQDCHSNIVNSVTSGDNHAGEAIEKMKLHPET